MIATLHGKLVRDTGKGTTIGVPTMNLSPDVATAMRTGVYSCIAVFPDGSRHKATCHIGPRPTVGDPFSCEVHVIDEVIETAPTELTVELIDWIRGIEHFPSIEALKEAIEKDIAFARATLTL
jgi:riboflavin kinase/FMN adenylyltransferase